MSDPSDVDPYQFGLDVQNYTNQASDSAFALSCFGLLVPNLPDEIVNVIDALATSTGFEVNNKIAAPTSIMTRAGELVTFSTKPFESGALSLILEGAARGLKGSGAQYRNSHERRMLAGYIIGSELAENTDTTPWVADNKILKLSLPQLAAIFDVYHPNYKPKSNQLEQVLEDPDAAHHYRFAASAGMFVLSCSLANVGALGHDQPAVYERIRKRMINLANNNAERLTGSALSETEQPYNWDELEAGLTIAALGSAFSMPAMINAMTHFVQTQY